MNPSMSLFLTLVILGVVRSELSEVGSNPHDCHHCSGHHVPPKPTEKPSCPCIVSCTAAPSTTAKPCHCCPNVVKTPNQPMVPSNPVDSPEIFEEVNRPYCHGCPGSSAVPEETNPSLPVPESIVDINLPGCHHCHRHSPSTVQTAPKPIIVKPEVTAEKPHISVPEITDGIRTPSCQRCHQQSPPVKDAPVKKPTIPTHNGVLKPSPSPKRCLFEDCCDHHTSRCTARVPCGPKPCVATGKDKCCPTENQANPVYLSHPSFRSMFYQCDWGMARLFTCPADTVFNPELNVCVFKDQLVVVVV